jgi:hypothetical protein
VAALFLVVLLLAALLLSTSSEWNKPYLLGDASRRLCWGSHKCKVSCLGLGLIAGGGTSVKPAGEARMPGLGLIVCGVRCRRSRESSVIGKDPRHRMQVKTMEKHDWRNHNNAGLTQSRQSRSFRDLHRSPRVCTESQMTSVAEVLRTSRTRKAGARRSARCRHRRSRISTLCVCVCV